MIFRKGGRIARNMQFSCKINEIGIVNNCSYLCIVFTTGGALNDTVDALSGHALNSIYKPETYLRNFTQLKVSHYCEVFDKFILPVLCDGSEVWGHLNVNKLKPSYVQFHKQILGVRKHTQNNCIYGELGRCTIKTHSIVNVIRYWLKVIYCEDRTYIKQVYNMMLNDLETYPQKSNWAMQVRHILQPTGVNDVCVLQGDTTGVLNYV